MEHWILPPAPGHWANKTKILWDRLVKMPPKSIRREKFLEVDGHLFQNIRTRIRVKDGVFRDSWKCWTAGCAGRAKSERLSESGDFINIETGLNHTTTEGFGCCTQIQDFTVVHNKAKWLITELCENENYPTSHATQVVTRAHAGFISACCRHSVS